MRDWQPDDSCECGHARRDHAGEIDPDECANCDCDTFTSYVEAYELLPDPPSVGETPQP